MMRIRFHPILGELADGQEVTIYFEGQPVKARSGECIAAALMANGLKTFRRTAKRGEERGYFCGIGQCTDCVMIVNGVPNVRTCVTAVQEGMRVERQRGLGRWGS
ncbi:MAG: (2Fe-2S)-binding protein [Proteobacteria bacterium]|nr:(2Fe-2S)-binding protein [Pseudomonadota bacterium]